MKYLTLPFWCSLAFITAFSGCKKAEQPATPAPQTEVRPATPIQPEKAKQATTPAPKPAANLEKGVVLKVKWPVGNRYVYRMDLDQHTTNNVPQMPKPMQQDLTMAMTYAISVPKETANGGHELEMEFLANEMEIKVGGQTMMSFDSKEPPAAGNPIAEPLRKMIGSKVRMEVDADGKVQKVLNLDEWSNSLAGDGGPAKGLLAQQFNESFFRQIAGFGIGLPDKAVDVGNTWPFQMDIPAGMMGKITLNSQITFKGWEDKEKHHCAVLQTTGTIKGGPGQEMGPMRMTVDEGKITGTSWFDPDLGALIETVGDQAMHLKGDMPGAPGNAQPAAGGFTVDLGQKVTLKLVELGKTGQ